MYTMKTILKYTTQDPIKVLTIIPITVDKSTGAIVKSKFRIRKKTKQNMNNILCVDFFMTKLLLY